MNITYMYDTTFHGVMYRQRNDENLSKFDDIAFGDILCEKREQESTASSRSFTEIYYIYFFC